MKKGQRIASVVLAAAMAVSFLPGVALTARAAGKAPSWPDMGPSNIPTERVTYTDGSGKEAVYHRSVRDGDIRPDHQLKLTSDSDYLTRAFQTSLDYTYNELVVGPRQFPLDTTGDDGRVRNHYAGIDYYTSTAVPSIWGTYHGFPGGGYRECFCDRDVSHTAEAGSLLSLDEENYGMLSRFAEESVETFWRSTSHGWNNNTDVSDPGSLWETKSAAQKWFPLWSQDFYGDAYYMDASFRELPAPFEVLDKVWTQYRWTGDERWISDTMLNYGYHINSYENGLMEQYDYDGDGLVDNVRYYDWAPTLYEYEDASVLQKSDVEFVSYDTPIDDGAYRYEAVVTLKPDYFDRHTFYQLPINMKLVSDSGVEGERNFILRVDNRPVDTGRPAVLRNYDRLNSSRDQIRDVEIPLYVPDGVTFEVYEGVHKLRAGIDYTVDTAEANYPVVTLKKEFFSGNEYGARYTDTKIGLGIVTRFYRGGEELDRATTELYLNTGTTIDERNLLNVTRIERTVGGVTTTVTPETDPATGVTFLDYDYEDKADTSYTLTMRYQNPVGNRMNDGNKKLKDYFPVTSDLIRVLVAGDTIGCQYQALRGMAAMIRARVDLGQTVFQPYHYEKTVKINDGEPITLTYELAEEYDRRADAIAEKVRTEWTDPTWGYARAINRLGEKDGGWGHENSFFMPMKELLEPGGPTQKYLNFIQMNALMEETLNEEALTYMPETFYMHGQNVSGWQWAKVSMNRLDPEQRDASQIMSTYPEIALINIYNTINLMMGVEPGAAKTEIDTLPRLTDEVGWVQVENIPLTQSGRDAESMNGFDSDGNPRADDYSKPKQGTLYTVRHDGTVLTTLTNQGLDGNGNGGDVITWNARFYGNFDTLYVIRDGEVVPVTGGEVGHIDYAPVTSYITLTVAPGETVSVSTLADPTRPAPNTEGFLYLSDQEYLYASYPESNGAPRAPKMNTTYTGACLYSHDFMESWDKGIGTKADTTIRYLIPAEATGFTAKAALTDYRRQTDPADTTARIRFEVYVDGMLMQTVTADKNNLEPQEIGVDFPDTGRPHTLDLVTTAVGDNRSPEEGGAWLDAKIAVAGVDAIPGGLPDTQMYLSDLTPGETSGKVVTDGCAAESGKPMTMGGRALQKGVSIGGEGFVTYSLGGIYQSMDLTVGYQDGRSGETLLRVYLDDGQTPVWEKTVRGGGQANPPETVTVDLTTAGGGCADTLRLVSARVDGKSQDCVNWADCILTLKEGTDLTDPAIIAKRILSAPDAVLGQTGYDFPAIPAQNPENYAISIKSSSDADVLALDGTITADAAEHLVDVVFRITEKDGAQRAADTRSFTVYIPANDKVSLTRLKFTGSDEGNGRPTVNRDNDGKKLKLDDSEYECGIGLKAAGKCEAVFSLEDGTYKRFTAKVGYAQNSGWNGNDSFRIFVEGIAADNSRTVLYGSPVIIKGPYENNQHLHAGNASSCSGSCIEAVEAYGYATSDVVDIDIPADCVKLAIRAERVGDSFWGYGAVCEPYFYLDSPFEGREVESIVPAAVQTTVNMAPVLPQMVQVKYVGVDQTRTTRVAWDPIDPALYAADKAGTSFTVEGAVDGTDVKALCTVQVKDKIITSASDASVLTDIGKKPVLPAQVDVRFSDGTAGKADVLWDDFEEGKWQNGGSFIVEGIVRDTALKVRCTVQVVDPNELLLAQFTPSYAKADNGLEYDQTLTLGGKTSYEHSIFAHAPSELRYELDGKYTRFQAALGSKNDGENPNIQFWAVGVDDAGGETLLYKTNMVSRVADPNAEPRTADQNGYYYVDGKTVWDVDVDVTGMKTLILLTGDVGTPNTDHAAYGAPKLYSANSPTGAGFHTVTVPMDVPGGAVWPNGEVAVSDGRDLVLTIKPNPANEAAPGVKQMALDALRLDGGSVSAADNGDGTYTLTIPAVAGDHSVEVSFKEKTGEEPPVEQYAVTVTGGTGGGAYREGETVTVTADTAPEGWHFTGWTAEGVTLDNDRLETVTFAMPANDVSLTADFEADPAVTHIVTVTGGTGGGEYAEGAQVVVTADEAAGGQHFAGWTATGLEALEGLDLTRPELSFPMPANDVNLEAAFEDNAPDTYTLTVNGGSGSGEYAEGDEVTVTAEDREGYDFTEWTASGLEGQALDPAQSELSFLMPANAVILTAGFEKRPVPVTGITLDRSSADLIIGGTPAAMALRAAITPADADNQDVVWSSGDESVATVDANGLVTAVADGSTVITAASAENGEICAVCTINVSTYEAPYEPPAAPPSNIERVTVKNPDGSTTTTVTNKRTGAVTETTSYPDGTTIILDTGKDGTVTRTVRNADGSESESVTAPDGTVTAKSRSADGIRTETVLAAGGASETTADVPGKTLKMDRPLVIMTPAAVLTIPEEVLAGLDGVKRIDASVSITPADGEADIAVVKLSVTADGKTVDMGILQIFLNRLAITEPLPPLADNPDGGLPRVTQPSIVAMADGRIIPAAYVSGDRLTVSLSGAAEMVITDNTKTFTDVAEGGWAADAIQFAAARELLGGVGGGAFAPGEAMTRAMLWTVLARLDGQDLTGGENWYAAARGWAMERGLTDGADPEAAVTREQLAVLLYRYAGSPAAAEKAPKFADAGQASDWAADALAWAAGRGILTGKTGRNLDPQGAATRAEVAVMLMLFVTATG